MASYTKSFLFTVLVLTISLISLIDQASSKKGSFTVDLIHRDSPLSPTYDASKTHFERLRKVFHRSFSRKSNLQSFFLKSTPLSSSSNDFDAPISTIGGEYLMKIQIGTPPVDVLAIADTGSDLTWTQCEPCTKCYKQKAPLFDPRKTSTYRSVSCQSEQCSSVGSSSSCDSANNCNYQMSYGDRSYSIGSLAVETLTFGSGSENNKSFPKFVFGCGHRNAGTFNETASGIIGLGGGSVSMINQLSSSIGGRFSYCLTALGSKVSSKIRFGTSAVVTGPTVVSTPITRKDPDTYYYLTLEGLSVGNKTVSYKSISNNKAAFVEEGNIIIDSGTTLTFLPGDMYEGLATELVDVIKATQTTDPKGMFKLCYEMPSDGEFNAPPITAHFSGADVVLPQIGTFIEVEKGLVCLTLVPSDNLAIFGNLHQMDYNIGYDLQAQTVSFLQTDCSKSE